MVVVTEEKNEKKGAKPEGSLIRYLSICAIVTGAGIVMAFFGVFVIVPRLMATILNQGPEPPAFLVFFHNCRFAFVGVVSGIGVLCLVISFTLRSMRAAKYAVNILLVCYMALFGVLMAAMVASMIRLSVLLRNVPPEDAVVNFLSRVLAG